ncbi:MAG TPA: hypothetical protein VIN05_09885 [Roseovarius sp.]
MNYFAIGFAAAALAAVGAIDYSNQAGAAGQAPGTFPASAYLATYGQRIAEMHSARADAAAQKAREGRRSAGARVYLPEVSEGWHRRGWAEGDNSPIQTAKRELSAAAQAGNDAAPMLKAFADKAERKAEAELNDETWVYQGADGLVAVRAAYHPGNGEGSIAGSAGDMLAASGVMSQMKDPGWDVIHGVAFGIVPASAARPDTPFVSRAGTPFRTFQAAIGFDDAVHLKVYSSASDAETRAVLSAIDYDGINSLLTAPLPFIGSQAQPVAPEARQQLATLMIKIREDLLTQRSEAAQDWLQRASTPENAMTLALSEIADGWGAGGIVQVDLPATAEGQGAAPSGFGAGGLGGFVKGIFGGDSDAGAQDAPAEPPKRLKLSGGSSCLDGSSGRFCRD